MKVKDVESFLGFKWVERKKRMDMKQRTSEGFWRAKEENNKSTGTLTSEERRKIQDRNRYFRTCY